jgi:excinuclease ABC subunit A
MPPDTTAKVQAATPSAAQAPGIHTPPDRARRAAEPTGRLQEAPANADAAPAGQAGRQTPRTGVAALDRIEVVGANEHNLRNVSVSLPRDALTVFTGVSGSGKSSLAFDTLFKEGQRRFLESLSPYARQFLGQMEKPKVEHVEGLSPTVSIDQKTVNRNPRSTVGTITELYDHYRLLFARLGTPYCPHCQVPIASLGPDQIADRLLAEFSTPEMGPQDGPATVVYAPMVRERKGEYRKELEDWRQAGYVRARIDGQLRRLDEDITLARYKKHTLELVMDRFRLNPANRGRLAEALEKALTMAKGQVALDVGDERRAFSGNRTCAKCGQVTLPELEPRLFSFNDPQGMCPTCNGLGMLHQFSEDKLTDPEKSLAQGAFRFFTQNGNVMFTDIDLDYVLALAKALKVPAHTPWGRLPREQRRLLLHGNVDTEMRIRNVFRNPYLLLEPAQEEGLWPGFARILEFVGRFVGSAFDKFRDSSVCPDCDGKRLNAVARAVRFRGRTIDALAGETVEEALAFFNGLRLSPTEQAVGKDIFREIRARLGFLNDVGVGYISLDRSAPSLSGGEAQRIRLASQVGSGLQGVLYVLDEPSIGLHQTDNRKLIATLRRLRDVGNTVLVVEHDEETIFSADHVVDLGPGAGSRGGRLLAQGAVADLIAVPESVTGAYLGGNRTIAVPSRRRQAKQHLRIAGIRRHNLENLAVEIPLGVFVAVTGVSGSGKSTLVHEVLKPALQARLNGEEEPAGYYRKIVGLEHLDKVIEIDQSPIGRTPRSNPATYTKLFDVVRELFTQVPEARIRGYKPGRFSFNVKGGRCEACEGAGVRTIEMQFLSNVEVECEECRGRRFNEETLQIQYKGKTIRDVLDMTVDEAHAFFAHVPQAARILETLQAVGLGYLHIGQPSTTLSGGEAQRVKLASELRKRATGRTLYLLDEPTTGLHFQDIQNLLHCLNALVDQGNSVLVIEHNLDVIKVADWILDLGPGGGKHGGKLVAAGTPEQVAEHSGSLTGQVLRGVLRPRKPVFWAGNGKPRPAPRSGGRDLVVRGAEKNNLKHIDVTIPHNTLTVITGVSGSGKTSLAFDTVFAEGQARYVESLSTYARRFLGRMDKARVEGIEGLAPAIAIDQQNSGRSPRSTVATTTEIYDYLRLIYARVGVPNCPYCMVRAAGGSGTLAPLQGWSPTRLARRLAEARHGERVMILAPLYRPGSGHAAALDTPEHFAALAQTLVQEGFTRVRLGAEVVEVQEWLALPEKQQRLNRDTPIDLVIDRLRIVPDERKRLAEALESAYRMGHGLARLVFPDAGGAAEEIVSEVPGCVEHDHYLVEPLTPRQFSFNSHQGACPECDGLGQAHQVSMEALIAAPDRPLLEGALVAGPVGQTLARKGGKPERAVTAFAKREGIDLRKPWAALTGAQRRLLMFGDGKRLTYTQRGWGSHFRVQTTRFGGLSGMVLEWYTGDEREKWTEHIEPLLADVPCPACQGERLKPELRAVTLAGRNISQFCRLTVAEALEEVARWNLDKTQRQVAEQPLHEITARLGFLKDVGLGYLNLDRSAMTLSGGEAQRIRLASQLGSRLVGVLYVLDEPTIGLHPRDTQRLLATLKQLRDPGNTVLVVEHDPETIRAADHVIDIGPGAGHRGGQVVAAGTPAQIAAHPESLTGAYLSGRLSIPVPARTRPFAPGRALTVRGAKANNLKDVTAMFPLGCLTAVTGVSGSGKSTLVVEVLQKALQRRLSGERVVPGAHATVEGLELVEKVVVVDQSPIGRSPKSNPATYTGALDPIRSLMSQMPEAKRRGYGPGRFSFNVPGGRCEACEGRGYNHIEMHFLADVWIPCEVCGGKRFNRETLEVTFRGKNMADILELEIGDALELFAHQRQIVRRLQTLADVGLGYMKLGQSGTTLSGGEAQRVKLAAELGRPPAATRTGEVARGKTVYILDEPTTGLHLDDTAKLITVLHRLVDQGNTVILIEHNLDVIKTADWVIDLGPEGGESGGRIVATGTPRELARHPSSHTGKALRGVLVWEDSQPPPVRCAASAP